MAGPRFFETRMGQQFYDGRVPKLIGALESLDGKLGMLREDVMELDRTLDRLNERLDTLAVSLARLAPRGE